jgi:serine/threonine protein phosphatase PrpC
MIRAMTRFYSLKCLKAILAREADGKLKAIPLTKDHSPIYAAEASRIQAAGGFIQDGRVNGRLEVSRAFGDPGFKKSGVVSIPCQWTLEVW